MSYATRRKIISRVAEALCAIAVLLALIPLAMILFYVIKEGAGALNFAFFTQMPKPVGETGGGMANAIVGTLILIGIASAFAVPIGCMTGIHLAEYPTTRFSAAVRFAADVLNGVPSIVWGMVVYALLVVPFKSFSAYAGGVALGLMMVPLVMRTTEEVLILVPQSYREAGLALGIARWKIITVVVIKTALKGIVTGVLVALARVAGETAPLLFTALGNNFWNHNLGEPIAAIPLQIFAYAISPYDDWHRLAWGGALVLIALIVIAVSLVRYVTSRGVLKGAS